MKLNLVLPALLTLATPCAFAQQTEWKNFHGNAMAQKYSASTQITPENVGDLEKAWEIHTGDVSDGSGELVGTVWSATPILANDLLYVGTPFYRIIAVRPDTGEVVWTYAPDDTVLEPLTQPELKNRGVTYWEDAGASGPCAKRVYIGTMDAHLHAVDADTGKLCTDFGNGGILNVNQWNKPDANFPLSQLQPPTVFRDKLLLGWAGKDWYDAENPLGSVFAVDARTGEASGNGLVCSADVHFATMTRAEIEDYVATGEPLQVAGSFTLDGRGSQFIERVDGDPNAVIGLSLSTLRTLLAGVGIRASSWWGAAAQGGAQ